ncbi:hypothetical protein [Nocardioides donggukensis]|uniref:Uncharacterized protein n=1 Tax=Nocardioides donggukensis TaxID=2774019 RepID=A0A927Q269_9ACTN|nr:hypothetical protein [Nocardioides donggukensis]MBD8870932.1 hypothetical protein [Nocardioides donggukensis]
MTEESAEEYPPGYTDVGEGGATAAAAVGTPEEAPEAAEEGTAAPTPPQPNEEDKRFPLWERVQEALLSLPPYFRTETNIEGLQATDLFTLNTMLGATIEIQIVQALNAMREVWDPDDEYKTYGFERRSQTFPDVVLVSRHKDGTEDILFGIELKGWYLLSKEAEPSFRYKATPNASSEWDLLVVVPWYLHNVLSGSPKVLAPFITSSRHAAAFRNYWWQHVRDARSTTDIEIPDVTPPPPYFTKSTAISDKPKSDSGGNFGRVARIGLMDEWVEAMLSHGVAGIAARHWIDFFKTYTEDRVSDLEAIFERWRKAQAKTRSPHPASERISDLLDEVAALLRES